MSELEVDIGDAEVSSLQSSFVQLPSQVDHEKRVKQFSTALRTLKLKPYVHPSQLQDTLVPDSTAEAKDSSADNDKSHTTRKKTSNGKLPSINGIHFRVLTLTGLENIKWPQLVVLVQGMSRW